MGRPFVIPGKAMASDWEIMTGSYRALKDAPSDDEAAVAAE